MGDYDAIIQRYLNRDIKDDCVDISILKNEKIIHKIKRILSFNADIFKKNINIFYKFFFSDYFKVSRKKINEKIDNYFIIQHESVNIGSILSYINFQFLIVTYCNQILNIMKNHISVFDISKALPVTSIIYTENPLIKDIVTHYVNNIKLEVKTNISKPKLSNKSIKLTKIISKSLPMILPYLSNEYICYGSYTAHCINSSIVYADIDLYHNNAYKFLIFYMVLFYFILSVDVYIFSIPFITGHVSLKHNDDEILDCIFLPVNVINSIQISIINNISFIEPSLQMLNNIRMGVELFRSNKINLDTENTINKFYTLLNYSINNNFLDLNKINKYLLKKIDFIYKYENGCIIVDFKKICPLSVFDKVIVLLHEPPIVISELSKMNGMFSKKYQAFLNEIFFESNIGGTNVVDESSIITLKRDTFNAIYKDENPNLYFTNYTTTVFVNDKNEISFRNKLSIIATIALYNFLHKRYEFACEVYYILLNLMNKNVIEDLSTFNKIDRHKISGDHKKISIQANYFKSIFNNTIEINYEFCNYKTFIEDYGLTGGF